MTYNIEGKSGRVTAIIDRRVTATNKNYTLRVYYDDGKRWSQATDPSKERIMRNHYYSITVPSMIGSTVNEEKQIEWVEKAQRLFSQLFGGSTDYQANGSWVDDKGSIVKESVVVVESYATTTEHTESLRAFARQLKADMAQDCVMIVLNGTAELIGVDDVAEAA